MSIEWKGVRLEEVTSIIGDGLHGTPIYDEKGDYFFINGNNLIEGRIVFHANTKRTSKAEYLKNKKSLNSNTILVSINGTLGNVALYNGEKVVLGKSACYLNVLENVDRQFIRYILTALPFQQYIFNQATGSTIKNVSLKLMRNFAFLLPPFTEQTLISTFLGALDDRIVLLRETNATLEAIAQALFRSWFVDFDPVRAKQEGREPEGMDADTAALFPDSFEESELGFVPKGWRWSNLDEVSSVGIGKTPPRKETQWFSESPKDVRWVSIRDMGTGGVYISQTSEYLTRKSIDRFNVRLVPDNTVLLSFKMTIGRVVVTDGLMATNEAIAHFKLEDDSPLTSDFIYLYLKQFDYSTLSSTSSIADAVNSKTVKNIPILVAASSVLVAFQVVVSKLLKRIKSIEHQIQTLISIRDTLLPRLLSGQLRVSDANIETVSQAFRPIDVSSDDLDLSNEEISLEAGL